MDKAKIEEILNELKKVLTGIDLNALALDDFEALLEDRFDSLPGEVAIYDKEGEEIDDRPRTKEEVYEVIEYGADDWARNLGRLLGEEVSRLLRARVVEMQEVVEHCDLHSDIDADAELMCLA